MVKIRDFDHKSGAWNNFFGTGFSSVKSNHMDSNGFFKTVSVSYMYAMSCPMP